MYPIIGWKKMTGSQVKMLMKRFEINPYPQTHVQDLLAKSLNISQTEIVRWFRHMRHKKLKQKTMKIPRKRVMLSSLLSVCGTYI